MSKHSKTTVQHLCERLQVNADFLEQCLSESVIKIHESEGQVELDNGTFLHLRKLERVCRTFDVDVPTAIMLRDLLRRVAELEEEIHRLRKR